MNIYKLSRLDKVGHDEAVGFVILAQSVDEARRIASDKAGDEGPSTWVDDKLSLCELIGDGPLREDLIVLRAFNAG